MADISEFDANPRDISGQIINSASDRNPGRRRREETYKQRADPLMKVRVRTCPECVVTGETRAPALGWRAARTAFIAALWCDVSVPAADGRPPQRFSKVAPTTFPAHCRITTTAAAAD